MMADGTTAWRWRKGKVSVKTMMYPERREKDAGKMRTEIGGNVSRAESRERERKKKYI